MIDATLLFQGTTVFSPWFPRQADMLRVTAECMAVNAATLTITLYTKSAEETGDGENVDTGTSISLSSVTRTTQEWKTEAAQNGVNELLRFRFQVTGENATDWILFRLLPAQWFDAVKAT